MNADPGLTCLAMLARLHASPADPAQLRHELGLSEAATAADILRAARRLKLKAKLGPLSLERAAAGQVPLPAILILTPPAVVAPPTADAPPASDAPSTVVMPPAADAVSLANAPTTVDAPKPVDAPPVADTSAVANAPSASAAAEAPLANTRFVILAKVENGQALLHDPVAGRPLVIATTDLAPRLTGEAIFITSRAQLSAELAHFDFTWFLPAIVKYRRLLSEALIASLFLQLFALLTPLFFQVVMDKVLVHKGISTLTVISIGLTAVVLFESVLSALRNYVFAHTTSRIDVELGTQLFRHLLSLPLAYFEARRVGDSVARVRELENIRQFLTGPALMSMLDLGI